VARVSDVQTEWQHVQDASRWGWFADWWPIEDRARRWGGQPELVFPGLLALEGMADVTAVTFGVFALLIAVCLVILFRMVGAAASPIPVIGSKIDEAFGSAAGWVWNLFADWAHKALDVIVTMAKWTWAVLRGIPGLSAHFFGVVFDWQAWVYDHVIPAYFGGALAEARNLYNSAVGIAQGLYNRAVGTAWSLYRDARGFAQGLYNSAVAIAAADAARVAGLARSLFTQAITYVDGRIHGVELAVAHDVAVLDGAIHDAEVRAATALNGAVHAIEGEFGRVEHTLADILGVELPTLARTLTGEIAGAAAIAAAATAVVAKDWETWRDNCGKSLCGGLLQDAESALGLLQVIEGGAIFAFLAAAIREPQATADEAVGAVEPVVSAAGSLIDQLVGIAA
jgi:hypothetical protein